MAFPCLQILTMGEPTRSRHIRYYESHFWISTDSLGPPSISGDVKAIESLVAEVQTGSTSKVEANGPSRQDAG